MSMYDWPKIVQPRPLDFGKVFVTETALAKTTIRLFPESKNRSKRIHKKLIKRFGGEFKMEPAIFEIEGRIYIHPFLNDRLRKELAAQIEKQAEDLLFFGKPRMF